MKTNANTLHLRVKQELLDSFREIPLNSRIATRTELTERFGVARTTIDRAISELIGEGYLSARVGSGTYVISHESKTAAARKEIMLGILLPNIISDTYPEIMRGAEDVCSQTGVNLVLCNTDHDIQKQEKYIRQLISSGVAGTVLVPAGINTLPSLSSFDLLREHDIPFVLCNRNVEAVQAPKVVSNDFYGTQKAVNHLFDHGWKRPAFISVELYQTAERRYHGYLSSLYENGMEPDDSLIFLECPDRVHERGYAAMRQLLRLPNPPDSVFCFNDVIAAGAYKAIEEAGLMAGRDIGVVGYDDSRICEQLEPKLTSVRFPKYEIGQTATELLLKLVRREAVPEKNLIILKPTLVVRKSCGESG